ncbi:uncharacterized protein LOC144873493 isoform X3 [Branchiostoma floridae x Branchiostoma japonicum]
MRSPPKRLLVYSLLLASFFISGGLYPSMQLGLSEAVTKWAPSSKEIGEETPSSRGEIPSPSVHEQRGETEKTPWYINFIRAFLETELGPDSRISKRSTKHKKHHVQSHAAETSGKHEKRINQEGEEPSSKMDTREEKGIGYAVVQAMQDSENALHQFLRESLLTRSEEEIEEELNERVKKQDDGDWVQAMGIVHHLMFPIGQIFFAFPGGFVAAKGSAVKILGTMMFVSCLVHLFVPLPMTFRGSPHTGDVSVAVMMFLEGCCQGVTIPAAYGVLHRWAPKSERSTMVSLTLATYYLGRLSGQFACAALKQAHGYMPAFYIYGPLGLIWAIVWVLTVKPNPSLDDNISTKEKDKINSGKDTGMDGTKIPMKEVLTDRNTVSYLATGLCFAWGMSVLLNHAPQYFAEKVALDVGQSPWLLWTLPLVMAGGMLLAGPGADVLISKGASTTKLRKVVTGFVCTSVFSFVMAMAFTKDPQYAYGGTVASLVMIGMAMGGGYGVTPLDASDRYSSIVVGIGVSLNTILFLVSPVIVLALNKVELPLKRQTEDAITGWKNVHVVTAVVISVAPIIYGIVMGKGKLLTWPPQKPKLPKLEWPSLPKLKKLKCPSCPSFPKLKKLKCPSCPGCPSFPKLKKLKLPSLPSLPSWSTIKRKAQKRYLMAAMSSLGFMIQYGGRANLAVSMVTMVMPNPLSKRQLQFSNLDWGPYSQLVMGAVHASFFLGLLASRPFANPILRRVYATRAFACSIFVSSILHLLIPVSAAGHYSVIMLVRILQGMAEGMTTPAMYGFWVKWAPASEMSSISSFTVTGQYIGIVVGMVASGFLAESAAEWPCSFYVYGGLGVAWSFMWFASVYPTPEFDPGVTEQEWKAIMSPPPPPPPKPADEEAPPPEPQPTYKPTDSPYKSMLKSPAALSIWVCEVCVKWVVYLMLTFAPLYYVQVHEQPVSMAGVYSGVHFALFTVGLPLIGYPARAATKSQTVSTNFIRKSFNFLGLATAGSFLLSTALEGDSLEKVVPFLTTGFGALAFPLAAGYNVNALDIAGVHASKLMGVSGGLSTIMGIITPICVGGGTLHQNAEEWNIIWTVSAGLLFSSATIFLCCGSGSPEDWSGAAPAPSEASSSAASTSGDSEPTDSDEKPEDKPAEEKPTEDKPAEDKPAEDTPAE